MRLALSFLFAVTLCKADLPVGEPARELRAGPGDDVLIGGSGDLDLKGRITLAETSSTFLKDKGDTADIAIVCTASWEDAAKKAVEKECKVTVGGKEIGKADM